MASVETIYQKTVLPLPPGERIKLAELILERAKNGSRRPVQRRSVLEILQTVSAKPIFKNAAEVDKHLKSERESWEN